MLRWLTVILQAIARAPHTYINNSQIETCNDSERTEQIPSVPSTNKKQPEGQIKDS